MNTSTERHPGDTILPEEEKTDTLTLPVLCPSSVSPSPSAPPMIVLGSADVNEETLFRNGLTQNIIILFDLF